MKIIFNVTLILVISFLTRVSSEETDQGVEPRFRLLDEVASKMVDLVSATIKDHKKVFEKLIEAGEKSEHKDEAEFKIQLNQFATIIDSIQRAESEGEAEENLQLTLKLFTIYENISILVEKYDITNSRLQPKERIIAEMLKEAGLYKAELEFYQKLQGTSNAVKTLVENYFNALSDAEKTKEEKMLAWLKKTEDPKSFGANLNLLFDFFDIYA